MAQFLVYRVNAALTLDVHQAVYLVVDGLLRSGKLRQVSAEAWPDGLVCQVVLYCIGQYEISIRQSLHEGRCTESVCAMVREVALSDGKESWYGCLQFIVYPDTTHSIMYGREYHHGVIVLRVAYGLGKFTGIDIGNLLVHVEEVTITLANLVDTQALDALAEVQEYGKTRIINSKALVATLLGST